VHLDSHERNEKKPSLPENWSIYLTLDSLASLKSRDGHMFDGRNDPIVVRVHLDGERVAFRAIGVACTLSWEARLRMRSFCVRVKHSNQGLGG
jgi:hypothetical protein